MAQYSITTSYLLVLRNRGSPIDPQHWREENALTAPVHIVAIVENSYLHKLDHN